MRRIRSVLHGLLALAFLFQYPGMARAGMTCSYSLVISNLDRCSTISGCDTSACSFAVEYREVCSAGSINSCPSDRCGVFLL